MLYSLLAGFSPSAIFLFARVFAILITIIGLNPTQKLLLSLKVGQPLRYIDTPTLEKLHENKKNTPTMGGGLLIAVFFILGALFLDFSQPSAYLILVGYGLTGLLGAWDDFKKLTGKSAFGLSSKQKFLLQISIGLIICLLAYSIDRQAFFSFFDRKTLPIALSISFFVFIFVGSSNAVNLTDGLDGLASGVVAIVSFGLLASCWSSSYFEHSYNELLSLSMIMGTAIGFLWMNQFPAKIFMGDTGSLSYGAILALISYLLKREWLYAFMGIIFVAEALSVILQVASYRLRNKKRIFLCTPIHHHFQYLGMNEVKIVTRFWIVSIIFVIFGLIGIL